MIWKIDYKKWDDITKLACNEKTTGNITKAKAYAGGVLAVCVGVSVCGTVVVCVYVCIVVLYS